MPFNLSCSLFVYLVFCQKRSLVYFKLTSKNLHFAIFYQPLATINY